MWRSGERIIMANGARDIFLGAIGLVAAPVVGGVVGHFVDALIPMPSTPEYPLLPEIPMFEYAPSLVEIPSPAPPAPPTLGAPPEVAMIGRGLPYDFTLLSSAKAEVSTASRSLAPPLTASVETSTSSSDEAASISTSVETEVA
jgi:hypothetical protein